MNHESERYTRRRIYLVSEFVICKVEIGCRFITTILWSKFSNAVYLFGEYWLPIIFSSRDCQLLSLFKHCIRRALNFVLKLFEHILKMLYEHFMANKICDC